MRFLKNILFSICMLLFSFALDYHLFREKNVTKNTKWWLLAAALFAILLGLAACTPHRVPVIRIVIFNAGLTTCDEDGNPVVVISSAVPNDQVHFIRAHEMEHVREVQESGVGCRKFMERYAADPDFRFMVEARAYCVDLNQRAEAGFDREQLLTGLTSYMKQQYANLLPLDSVRSRLSCGGRHDPP